MFMLRTSNYAYNYIVASSISYDTGRGTGPILISNVRCRGTSTKLSECSFEDNHIRILNSNCNHDHDVQVACVSGITIIV